MTEELSWTAAQRAEGWAGEVRVNLVRLVAITAFYGHHLVNYYLLKADLTPPFHLAVTAISIAWALAAFALHLGLSRTWNPPWLRHAAVAFDALMATTLLLVSDGTKSPLVVVYFLIVASAALRLDLRLVWTATGLAVLGYLVLCGHAKWVRPEWQVLRSHQIIVAIGLACSGLLAGQAVRQAKRLARDYAERLKPPEAPPS